MTEASKIRSSYQKDINRIRKKCNKLYISNALRKYQISQFDIFIKKLIKENRITKEEISQFMEKREEVITKINHNYEK